MASREQRLKAPISHQSRPFRKVKPLGENRPFLKLSNSGVSLASWDVFWRLRSAHLTIHLAQSLLSLKEPKTEQSLGILGKNEASHSWLKPCYQRRISASLSLISLL